MPPFVLIQLSDPHIGAEWAGADPVARLEAAVASVRARFPHADAVLVSGDLAEHAADTEYERVRDLLSPLSPPVHVFAGNHDDRRALHRHFGVSGSDGEPAHYAVDLGPVRLVVLDTTIPGEDAGTLDSERLAWLDAELARAAAATTLLAMHHPPLRTGVPAWDEIGLPVADRLALGAVLERHPQVCRIVCGHVHRAMTGELAGRPVVTAPSTYVQARLDFSSEKIELSDEPTGFAVHTVLDGDVISHVQPTLQLSSPAHAPVAGFAHGSREPNRTAG
jgi:3',5'-cyclic AMP phosphodiesterase CpdA